jgi:hypothetical protein
MYSPVQLFSSGSAVGSTEWMVLHRPSEPAAFTRLRHATERRMSNGGNPARPSMLQTLSLQNRAANSVMLMSPILKKVD